MIEQPQIDQTKTQHTAAIRLAISRTQVQRAFGPAIAEVMAAIAAQSIEPAGPVYAHHLKMGPDFFDFELGVPVVAGVSATGRVKPSHLPAATVARTLYHEPYEGLPSAWGEFMAWITTESHHRAPNLWERYLVHPKSNPGPAAWRAELNRPLVR